MPDEHSDALNTLATLTEDGETSVLAWSQPEGALPAPLPSSERYEDLGCIGQGGMGEVRRVLDHHLGCTLAMKLLGQHLTDAPHARARFLHEARLTARLSHPGVVAVQDHGELADGRPWFTMTEVRGSPLDALLQERTHPLRRLVGILTQVCEVIAYAHSMGVIHRDIKPANVMVGRFGEVYVMDWGLGRQEGTSMETRDDVPLVPLRSNMTRTGQVMGTPAYMPPEQAAGRTSAIGPPADIYALGAILFHILSGRPPHGRGPWRPADAALVPPGPLQEICARAMAIDPAQRYPDAAEMVTALRHWQDGARRREQAHTLMDQADAARPEIARLRTGAATLRDAAAAALAEIPTWRDPVEKRTHWAMQDAAEEKAVAAEVAEVDWLRTVRAALDLSPDLPRARAALAGYYRERLLEAERASDSRSAARYEALLREWDHGSMAGFLRGEGRLTLLTAPAGAEVWLSRCQQVDRRLVPEEAVLLGTAPIRDHPLPRGSYRLLLRASGCEEATYPVLIERGGLWDGTPPGSDSPQPVRLLPAGSLGPDEVFVPAGWFRSGGDPAATEPLPARRLWVDDFVIERFPVTHARYLDFLNALIAAGRVAEALEWAPRNPRGRGGDIDAMMVAQDDRGRFTLPRTGPRPIHPDWPVSGVTWHAAVAFTRWRSEETGLPWRLPNELEWEKAARGVDGRFCVWGNTLEHAWMRILGSTEGAPSLVSVTDYPLDVSIYGVRGMMGNVRDWCANTWSHTGPTVEDGRVLPSVAEDADPDLRVLRGGSWSTSEMHSRCAGRLVNKPGGRFGALGFRLLRTVQW